MARILERRHPGIDDDEQTDPDKNKGDVTSLIVMNKSSLCYVEYDFETEEIFSKKPTKELFNLGNVAYFGAASVENIFIVGSCNGLVCLTIKIDDYLCGHVYVCNPITKECVQLPSLVPNNNDYKAAGYRYNIYGFGYLPSSNEYKIVRISYKLDSRNIICSGKVHIYTLGDGRGWRDRGVITTNKLLCSDRQGILVDGALYWTDVTGGPEIAVFDLMSEKFYMLPEPPRSPSDWGNFKLGVLSGQLYFSRATTYKSSDIWLLTKKERSANNSDVKEQDGEYNNSSWVWSKRTTMSMEDIHRYEPLTITKDGDILLLYQEKWYQERNNIAIRYDPKTSTSKELGDLGLPLPGYGKAAVHVNGFISLKSIGERTVLARL